MIVAILGRHKTYACIRHIGLYVDWFEWSSYRTIVFPITVRHLVGQTVMSLVIITGISTSVSISNFCTTIVSNLELVTFRDNIK